MPQKRSPVAERVIERVAIATESDEIDLPPLFDAIDPDALETVVETMSSGEITFAYADRDITVGSDGSVSVADESTEGPAAQVAVSNS
ncbi:HalOD1 output domain-containing protein [Halobellus salinisoli]|uniref:HalOD1 output domain-containing protein n=1 Tax=Halobellus salinisoli TaxID=3108500 RepID=UPI00300B7891